MDRGLGGLGGLVLRSFLFCVDLRRSAFEIGWWTAVPPLKGKYFLQKTFRTICGVCGFELLVIFFGSLLGTATAFKVRAPWCCRRCCIWRWRLCGHCHHQCGGWSAGRCQVRREVADLTWVVCDNLQTNSMPCIAMRHAMLLWYFEGWNSARVVALTRLHS